MSRQILLLALLFLFFSCSKNESTTEQESLVPTPIASVFYDINFETGTGLNLSSVMVEEGKTLGSIANPSNACMDFDGWYLEEDQ